MSNFGIVDLHSNGIHIELGGVTIGQIKVPSDYVPRSFAPVLGTHQLVTGDKLMNGLIVLLRNVPEDIASLDDYELERLNEISRWALVTDLKIVQRGEDDPLVHFTAIYADGTMYDRTYSGSYKWAVLNEFEMLPVCNDCGEVHEPESEEDTPDLETMTRRVTSELFGEEMSFDEFSDRFMDPGFVDLVADKMLGHFLGTFLSDMPMTDEQPNSEDAIPTSAFNSFSGDDLPDEEADRLRDIDESNGTYSQDERPKLKK